MSRLKSFSKVNSYITCPYQHYLRYTQKWYPKQKSRALEVGSAIHECCEAYRKNELDKFDFNMTNEIDLELYTIAITRLNTGFQNIGEIIQKNADEILHFGRK